MADETTSPDEPIEDVGTAAPEGTALAESSAVPLAAGLDNIVEALLLASESPLSLDQLLRLVGDDFDLDRKRLRDVLDTLAARLDGTANELREVAGGWRLQVRADYSQWVARLWEEKPPRFSRALLETLALVVYRQPITRGEIEEVRGVAVSSNILRTLLERGWIRELGHKEVLGRPMLYGTTAQLLDDLNLKSLSQLPELPAIKDLDQLEAALARLGLSLPEVRGESDAADATGDDATDAPLEDVAPAADDDTRTPPDTTLH